MSEKNPRASKALTIDWLVKGVLTKAGDAFDRFTGRSWQPSSSLATSELIQRLIRLIDQEVADLGPKGRFVPHVIRLRVDWETFGSDSADLLEKLERELTVALVDHINDSRYHTHAPIDLKVKTDYFSSGVKLSVGFEEAADDGLVLDIPVPQAQLDEDLPIDTESEPVADTVETLVVASLSRTVHVAFGDETSVLEFFEGDRISVGRTRENGLALEHQSVSRKHASLAFNSDGELVVADTGSTNGTFIDEERIDYGTAVTVPPGSVVKFGDVSVEFDYIIGGAEE